MLICIGNACGGDGGVIIVIMAVWGWLIAIVVMVVRSSLLCCLPVSPSPPRPPLQFTAHLVVNGVFQLLLKIQELDEWMDVIYIHLDGNRS